MKNVMFTRGPVTAQKNAEAATALDLYLLRGNPFNDFNFGRRARCVLFDTPTPEEEAAAAKAAKLAEEAEAKLIEKIEARIEEKYAKKFDGVSSELRRLKEGKTAPEPEPKNNEPKPKPTAADKELADRLAKIEERDARVKKNATRNALKSAFAAAGVTGDDEADAVDLFLSREGSKLIYDDENDTVLFKDSEVYDPKPVSDYIAGLDKAGKLNRYKRATETPPNDGGKGGTAGSAAAGKQTFSADDLRLGKVSREALRGGK